MLERDCDGAMELGLCHRNNSRICLDQTRAIFFIHISNHQPNWLASRYSTRPQPTFNPARSCAVTYIRGRPGLEGYQADGQPAVDASACNIPDDGPRPCGRWNNPAGTGWSCAPPGKYDWMIIAWRWFRGCHYHCCNSLFLFFFRQ